MRTGRLVVAGLIGGGMLTAAIMIAVRDPSTDSRPQTTSVAPPNPLRGAALARCRAVAEADPQCEAVWEAHRRAFFGRHNEPSGTGVQAPERLSDRAQKAFPLEAEESRP